MRSDLEIALQAIKGASEYEGWIGLPEPLVAYLSKAEAMRLDELMEEIW